VSKRTKQIHLAAHPDVSHDCAFDPACAMHAAYAISGGGGNFAPWATWTNGRAQQFMSQAQAAASSGGGMPAGGSSPVSSGGIPPALPLLGIAAAVAWALS